MIDYCPAVYLISNRKFKVSDKKIISCKKNYNNTYIHKIIVFDISVTSEMMPIHNTFKALFNLGLHTFLHMPCHTIAS